MWERSVTVLQSTNTVYKRVVGLWDLWDTKNNIYIFVNIYPIRYVN